MAPPIIGLADSVEAILDAIVAAIEAQRLEDGTITEVRDVVRGGRSRPQPKMPAIWVVPEPARNSQPTGIAETWSMAVHLAALVKDDDPVAGSKLAVKLAAKARAAVLTYQPEGGVSPRRLGLAYVNDVVSTSFDPAGVRGPENLVLHWADAVITVTWRTGGGA